MSNTYSAYNKENYNINVLSKMNKNRQEKQKKETCRYISTYL